MKVKSLLSYFHKLLRAGIIFEKETESRHCKFEIKMHCLFQGLLYLDGRNSQKYLHQNVPSKPGRHLNSNNATKTHSNFVNL